MTDIWRPANFLVASPGGAEMAHGYTYRGLGLHIVIYGSPKGRRPPTWNLMHLGTGHSVCSMPIRLTPKEVRE